MTPTAWSDETIVSDEEDRSSSRLSTPHSHALTPRDCRLKEQEQIRSLQRGEQRNRDQQRPHKPSQRSVFDMPRIFPKR